MDALVQLELPRRLGHCTVCKFWTSVARYDDCCFLDATAVIVAAAVAAADDVRTLHAQETIPTSLLKLGADNAARAIKMFGGVQKYMGVGPEARNISGSCVTGFHT